MANEETMTDEERKIETGKVFDDMRQVFEHATAIVNYVHDKTRGPTIGLLALEMAHKSILDPMIAKEQIVQEKQVEDKLAATLLTMSRYQLDTAEALATRLATMAPEDNQIRNLLFGVSLGKLKMMVIPGVPRSSVHANVDSVLRNIEQTGKSDG